MRAVATLRSVGTPVSLLSLLGQNEEKKTTLFCSVPVCLISKIPRVSQCDFLLRSFLCVLAIFVQRFEQLLHWTTERVRTGFTMITALECVFRL